MQLLLDSLYTEDQVRSLESLAKYHWWAKGNGPDFDFVDEENQ